MLVFALWAGFAQDPPETARLEPPRALEGNWFVEWHDHPVVGHVGRAAMSVYRPRVRNTQEVASGGVRWGWRPSDQTAWRLDMWWGERLDRGAGRVSSSVAPSGQIQIEYPYGVLGHWGGRSTVAPAGPDRLEGRWEYGSSGGAEVWRRASTSIDRVEFRSEITDVVEYGSGAGRVELRGPWSSGSTMRGNRPTFHIRIFGDNLWGHHVIDFGDAVDLEPLAFRPITDPDSTGPGRIIGLAVEVVVWHHAEPGRHLLHVDGIEVPFDLVPPGGLAEDVPALIRIVEPDGRTVRDELMVGEIVRVRVEYDAVTGAPSPAVTLTSSLDAATYPAHPTDDPLVFLTAPIVLTTGGTGEGRLVVAARDTVTARAPPELAHEAAVAAPDVFLHIEGVPDHARLDAGAFLLPGDARALRLHVSEEARRVSFTIVDGATRVRVWLDRARTRPVLLTPTAGGLAITWTATEAPSLVFVEAVATSRRSRDVIVQLAAAGTVFVLGRDQVALTVLDLAVGPWEAARSGPLLIGQNDDDDDRDGVKDRVQRPGPVLGEDDLLPLVITVRPDVPRTFGSVLLDASPGLSLWRSPSKGPGTAVIDALARSDDSPGVELPVGERNLPLFLEAVDLAPTPSHVRVEFQPDLLTAGQLLPIGPRLVGSVEIHTVRADLDIVGVLDVGHAEEDPGGVVAIGDATDRERMTELVLSLTPSSGDLVQATLEVTTGASAVRLWREGADGSLAAMQLTLRDDGSAFHEFEELDQVPRRIFVQGLRPTVDRAVEIELALREALPSGDARTVHHDRIALSVTGTRLVLDPAMVVVARDPAEAPSHHDLAVRLVADGGNTEAGIDVSGHAETEYLWIGRGLPVELAGLPLAAVAVDSTGRLTVTRGGVQLIGARHRGIESNYLLVLAGLALEDIVLSPVAALGLPVLATGDNPPLFLVAEGNGLVAEPGWIVLQDASFSLLDGRGSVSLEAIGDALEAILDRLPPPAQAIAIAARTSARLIGQQLLTFTSSDEAIARLSNASLLNGLVRSGVPGLAGVTGTLAIEGLGSASDTVLVVVLPSIDRVELRADGDEPGRHDGDIVLAGGDAERRVRAHAHAELARSAPITAAGGMAAMLPDGWSVGRDFEVERHLAGFAARLRGRLEAVGGEAEGVFLHHLQIEFEVPNERPTLPWLTNRWVLHGQGPTPDPAACGAGAHEPLPVRIARVEAFDVLLRTAPEAGAEAAMLCVEVALLGMGSASVQRRVLVHAEPTICVAGAPVVHLGVVEPERVADLDREFVGAPFATALARASGRPLAETAGAATGPFPARDAVVEAAQHGGLGWRVLVEFPVNRAELCGIALQRSVAVGDAGRLENLPLITSADEANAGQARARYLDPRDDALPEAIVVATELGWTDAPPPLREVRAVSQRVSVFDVGSDLFRATALTNIHMSATPVPGGVRFAAQHVGSASGLVDDSFGHTPALDATRRFSGLEPP